MMWYVRRGDREIGPLGEEALRALLGTGQIATNTQLWREDLSGWTEALTLAGVLGARATAALVAAPTASLTPTCLDAPASALTPASSPPSVSSPTPAPSPVSAPSAAVVDDSNQATSGSRIRTWVTAGVCLLEVAALIALGVHEWRSQPGYAATRTATTGLRQELAQDAERVNAVGPRMVDSDTILDDAQAGPGTLFTYEYTLTSISVDMLPATRLETLRWRLSQHVRQAVCDGSGLQAILREGVTIRFHYRDRDEQDLTTVDVASGDCGG